MGFESVEASVQQAVEWLRLCVEALGAAVIAIGIAVAVWGIVRGLVRGGARDFIAVRLQFARYLTLALELQLAADILSTSVAPTWERIGKLAAIAVIRTGLNYFLNKEIREEQRLVGDGTTDGGTGARNAKVPARSAE